MRRTDSPASVSSVISKGGVSAREKMVSASAFTSISPVGRFGFLWPPRSCDHAGDADAELAAQLAGQGVRARVDVRLEDHLREAAAVAQVDEDAAAVIAARGDPTEEHDALAGVGGAQGAAVVGPLQVGEELGHGQTLGRVYPRV